MHSGATFSCKVVQYDERRKKYGAVLTYPEAQLVWGDGGSEKARKREGERAMTDLEKKLSGVSDEPISDGSKNPNHAWHYTRNIRELLDGQPTPSIRKIHPPLIIEFNGEITTP